MRDPVVIGILNATPDSFSDGGIYFDRESGLAHAAEMTRAGASIIDVGAEASGPGAKPLTYDEERSRLASILPALCSEYRVSIDTYKAAIAAYALECGAEYVNDISALRADAAMVDVLVQFRAKVILMHSKESGAHPHATRNGRQPGDIVENIKRFLSERIEFALRHGIAADNIILDPGMGAFISTDHADSWEVLRRLTELVNYLSSMPVLIGVSRKGFLGGQLAERDPISQFAALEACRRGATYIRTHNPKMFCQFFEAAKLLSSQ